MSDLELQVLLTLLRTDGVVHYEDVYAKVRARGVACAWVTRGRDEQKPPYWPSGTVLVLVPFNSWSVLDAWVVP